MILPRTSILIMAFTVVVLTIAAAFVIRTCQQDWCLVLEWQKVRAVDSYERCVDLGFPIQESYPARCVAGTKHFLQPVGQGPTAIVACPEDAKVCPDGTVLTRQGPDCDFLTCPTACAPQGCNSELCGEAGGNLVSTCEVRPEYACYKTAACERQSDGMCDWTLTPALEQCLREKRADGAGEELQ